MIAESPVPTKPFRMPRGLITVLKWGGSVLALILALTGLVIEIFLPAPENGALGMLFWAFVLLGLAASIVGVISDRREDS
jgi:hypothetical protein